MVAPVLPAEHMPGDQLQRTTGRVHRTDKALLRANRPGTDSAFFQAQAVRTNRARLCQCEIDAFLGDIGVRRNVFFEMRDCSLLYQGPYNGKSRTTHQFLQETRGEVPKNLP